MDIHSDLARLGPGGVRVIPGGGEAELNKVGVVQAAEQEIPSVMIQGHEPVGEAGDGRGGAQGGQAIGTGGAVEEAGEAQGLHVLRPALGRGEPLLVGLEHMPGIAGLGVAQVVYLLQPDGVALADVAAFGREQVAPEQNEAQGVAGVVLGRLLQVGVAADDLKFAQQADGDFLRQFLQIVLRCGAVGGTTEFAEGLAAGDEAEAGIALGQGGEQVAQVGIGELSGLGMIERVLERLKAIQHQQAAVGLHELCQARALAGPGRGVVAEEGERSVEEGVHAGHAGAGGVVGAGALVVEGPVEVAEGVGLASGVFPALLGEAALHPAAQQGGLAHAAPGNDAEDIYRLRGPGGIEQGEFFLPPEEIGGGMAADEPAGGDPLLWCLTGQEVAQGAEDLNGEVLGVGEGDLRVAGAAAEFLRVPGLGALLRKGGGGGRRMVGGKGVRRRGQKELEVRTPGLEMEIGQPCFPLGVGQGAQVVRRERDDLWQILVTAQEVFHGVRVGGLAIGADLLAEEVDNGVALGEVVVELEEDGMSGGELGDVFLRLDDDLGKAQIVREALAAGEELVRDCGDEEAAGVHGKGRSGLHNGRRLRLPRVGFALGAGSSGQDWR